MKEVPDPAPGARFSHVYGQRGEPTEDSERMRHRIGASIASNKALNTRTLNETIEREIGIDPPWVGSWTAFTKKDRMKLQDLLDLITVVAVYLREHFGENAQRGWLVGVERIFREENVHYRVEPKGGVRFYIDEAFSRARASTIVGLSNPRYSNALTEFEKGMAALAAAPPDGKGAIRGVFGAAEAVFRLITDAPRLGRTELTGLSPILQRLYA
jgi:hypothetical protein